VRKASRDLFGRVGVSVDDMIATTSHLTPAVSHGQQDFVMEMEETTWALTTAGIHDHLTIFDVAYQTTVALR
jgi:hypothetical protein